MVKGRPLLQWAGILLGCAAASFFSVEARCGEPPAQAPAKAAVKTPETARPDLIRISTLAAYGKLELPPVTFFHDKHTDALLKDKKSCDTCHFVEGNKLSLAFKRRKETKPANIKDIYHANCIGCHAQDAAAGKQSGPLDGFCRSCHDAQPAPAAARLDAGLNKILHFRHTDSKAIAAGPGEKDNCGQCHHEYDKEAKKLFYAKGKEETCRYCHLAQPKNGVQSLEQASHRQCVQCHLDLASKGVKDNGPYLCAGCHGAQGVAQTAKKNQEVLAKLPNKEVPRLLRGQPDAALISYAPKGAAAKTGTPFLMNPVAFDHKNHEKYNDSCRVCHHAAIESCDKCHTLGGAKEGGFATFEQSMHLQKAEQSCVGCHAAKQAASNCAGCHSHMKTAVRMDDAACKQCHLQAGATSFLAGSRDALGKMTEQQKASLAAVMLRGRSMNAGTYPMGNIPEKVVIKGLADKYEPAEFKHREHVVTLLKGMKDNVLAGYFHRDPGTICQGCHHNSPPAQNPPGCANCHATRFDAARQPERPGLLAAYHDQCMGCHKTMALEKPAATSCTACHKEKEK